jgi:hypothetical protein
MSSSATLPIAEPAAGVSGRSVAIGAVRFAAVIGLFSLVTIVAFWPWFAHPGAALIGPPEDNMQDFWNTWYAAVGRDPAHFFYTKLLRFPEGTSLIYQSFAYPQVVAAVALSKAFGSDLQTLVALQNFTLLASFPLAGAGAFYLVRHLAQSTAGGLVGGFVFAFNPFHVAQAMHHAHVASIEFIPFFALAYLLALERGSWGWLAAASAFLALSALSCWYYLFYCAYFIAFHLFYQRLRDRAWPTGWPLQAPALCLAAAAVLLLPLIVPMVQATAPHLYYPGGNIFVADLLGYVTFPPWHLLEAVSRPLFQRFSGNAWEATVYLGLASLAAFAWYCTRAGLGRRSPAFFPLAGMIFFAVLASGETLHVAGVATIIHLPDIVLDKLPFAGNVRTPARAIVFVHLFLAIGVGLAVAATQSVHSRWFRIAAVAMTVLIVIDLWPLRMTATPVACPTGLSAIANDPDPGFGVLNLPLSYVSGDAYMLEQACHGRPIVDGVTTREMAPTLVDRLLATRDLSAQRDMLRTAHVKYVVLHRPRDGLFSWDSSTSAAQWRARFRRVYDGPELTVLRVD